MHGRHRQAPQRPAARQSRRASLHSEYVVSRRARRIHHQMTQTGTVDEITLSSIVVRSDDGYTQIYAFPSSAVVPKPSVAANDTVTVQATRTGPDGDPQQHRGGPTARQLTGAALRLRPEAVRAPRQSPREPPPTSRTSVAAFSIVLVSPSVISAPGRRRWSPSCCHRLSTAVNVPIATTALAPMSRGRQFHFLEFISDHSISGSGQPSPPAGTAGRTVRERSPRPLRHIA